MNIDPVAKVLVLLGIVLIIVGIGWQFGWIQQLRLGRLPGDIYIDKENTKIFIPITTSVLVSLLIALVNWLPKRILGVASSRLDICVKYLVAQGKDILHLMR